MSVQILRYFLTKISPTKINAAQISITVIDNDMQMSITFEISNAIVGNQVC